MTTRTPDDMIPDDQAGQREGPKPVRYIEHDGRDDAAHRTGEERDRQEGEPKESAEPDAAERAREKDRRDAA